MKKFFFAGAVIIAAVFFTSGQAGAGARVGDSDMSFSVDRASGRLTEFILYGEDIPGEGFLSFEDGARGEAMKPERVRLRRLRDGSVNYDFRFAGERDLAGSSGIKAEEGYFRKSIEVKNTGSEQRWVEVVFSLPYNRTRGFSYYDGFEKRARAGMRDVLHSTFPAASVYVEGSPGISVGIDPDQIFSYLRNECAVSDDVLELSYATRLVIDPGTSESVAFIFFPFMANYGFLDAISLYQDFFPEKFNVKSDIHPGIKGAASRKIWVSTHEGRHLRANEPNYKVGELARKFNFGWDWCPTGYGYRPGDWLCTEELTGDWEMRHVDGKKWRDYFNRSATEHMEKHHRVFNRYPDFDVAPLMYIIPESCEEDLAVKKYSDSIWYDVRGEHREKGSPMVRGPGWVTREEASKMMYFYGNSFGDYTFDALEKIVERTAIKGFSIDCFDRSRYDYYGPGAEVSPGRSYDEYGVYANMAVPAALLGRHIHSLYRDGYRMGIGAGAGGSYLSMFEVDSGITETSPMTDERMPYHIRLLLGRKQITWWRGYITMFRELGIVPGEVDADALIPTISALADYSLLRSLHLGYLMRIRLLQGVEKLFYYRPIIDELISELGWEPVPAFRADDRLWPSRYGRGVGACIVMGNPTLDDVSTDAGVDSGYFGEGLFVFLDYEGRVDVNNRFEEGRTLLEGLVIPGGEPLILRAGAQLEVDDVREAAAKLEHSPGLPGGLVLGLEAGRTGRGFLRMFVPGDMRAAGLAVNGENVSYEAGAGVVEADVELMEGMNEIRLDFRPGIEVKDKNSVLDFPFLKEGRESNFTIILPESAAGRDELMAWRVKNFFDVYVHGTEDPNKVVGIDSRRGEKRPGEDGNMLMIGVDNELDGRRGVIYREGGRLYVLGEDETAMEDAVMLLLGLLDHVYPFYGYAYSHNLNRTIVQRRTGVDYIPWER